MLSSLVSCFNRDAPREWPRQQLALAGGSDGGGEYLRRADVQRLFQRLEEERPENLQEWLQEYTDAGCEGEQKTPRLVPEASMARKVDEQYEMLDWRFFILNKEKDITTLTKRHFSRSKSKGFTQSSRGLNAFMPDVIREAICDGRISMEDSERTSYNPVIRDFDAAVVFMDASGFTALTESLARRTRGAEEIGSCLNGFFGPLIEIIAAYGGDILKFSGDAITILWPVSHFEDVTPEETSSSSARESAAMRAAAAACRCCLEVQARVASVGKTPIPGIKLTMHIGVGFGRLTLLQLGGLVDRWEYCAAGVPLEEVAVAEPAAKPGETVVSSSITQLIGLNGECGLRVAAGNGDLPTGYSQLLGADAAPEQRLRAASISPSRDLDSRVVKRYIPKAIRSRLKAEGPGYSAEMHAEMRRIAVIFLSVQGLNPGRSHTDAYRTQLIMRLFQRSVYALEGSINKFMVDDKGMVLLVVFGLQPVNHFTDDPTRAVLTATRLCDTLQEECLVGQAGVATGTCWCGVVGSPLRREYTVLGDTVNLSARLMGKTKPGTVLVDAATHTACQDSLEFEPLGAISLKGKSQQTEVFRFTGKMMSRVAQRERKLGSRLLSWENWPVKAELLDILDAQLSHPDGPGGLIFVKGGPGCGKTEAAALIEQWTRKHNFALLSGQNMNPTSTFAVPRLCWQEVFSALFQYACADPRWSQRMRLRLAGRSRGYSGASDLFQLVLAMLEDAGAGEDLLAWAPLLSFVVPGINFGAKGVSALLERDEQRTVGPPRLAELCSMLLESFTAFSETSAGTVVLVHLKSGTSVYHESYVHDENVARAVGELCLRRRTNAGGRPLIFCVVSRDQVLPDGWLLGKAQAAGSVVSAGDLDREGTERYMAHLLRAPGGLDPRLVDHVHDACGGNPFSVEVLSGQLEAEAVLRWSDDGRVDLAEGPRLDTLPYPEDLKGMALATFEKLKATEQALLKAAAVCCRGHRASARTDFGLEDLAGEGSPRNLEAVCESLVQRRIFEEVAGESSDDEDSDRRAEPERRFRFVSQLLQHVASTLVLEVQKKQILMRVSSMVRTPSLQRRG